MGYMDVRYQVFADAIGIFADRLAQPGVRCNGELVTQLRGVFIRTLAKAGIPVAPLVPGTTVPPKGSHGFRDASTDVSWLKELPEANFQIPTGQASGLVALDIDIPDGFTQLNSIVERWPTMAELITHGISVRSPSGGLHVWLPADDQTMRSGPLRDFPQVEVKADRTALTGPLTVRKSSEKKYGGMYLPLRTTPRGVAEFMQLSVPEGTVLEDEPVVPNAECSLDVLRSVQAGASETSHKSASQLPRSIRLSRCQAQNWLNVNIAKFTQLQDQHQRASNELVWTAVWLVSARFLTMDEVRANLHAMCPQVKYSDHKPRTSPYPPQAIDAVLRSVTNRVNELIVNDPVKAQEEMHKATFLASRMPNTKMTSAWVTPEPVPEDTEGDESLGVGVQGARG